MPSSGTRTPAATACRSCSCTRRRPAARPGSTRFRPSRRPATAASRTTCAAGVAPASSPDAAGTGQASTDLDALIRGLGLDRFVLIGAAYGGMGALDYALRFQERLLAFVLATSQGAIVDREYADVLDRIVPPALRGIPIELREVGPSYRAENPAGVERWLQIIHEAGAETAQRQQRFLTLTLDLLGTLRVPTLVLAADADLLAPPALMKLMAARIPGCEVATVADAGHSAHWERPEAWNRSVLDFLGRHAPAG